MKRDVVLGGLALGALVAVSLLGRRPEAPTGATRASADYSFGGYRAWYELLAREGVAVTRFRRHHDALRDSGIDTLIVAFPAGGLPRLWDTNERDALRAWVRGGGRLVDVGVTPPAGKGDEVGELFIVAPVQGARGPLRGSWSNLVTSLGDRGSQRLVRIETRKHKRGRTVPRAKPAPLARVETLLADRGGALAVRYPYGRGEVVGVVNAALFENRALGRGDDARLAFLAARPGPHGVVAFDEAVRDDIVEKAWYRALDAPELVALAVGALAGLLWLLYGIVPLGPAVRLRHAREPTSEEFVDAVAALYQRARARDHARDALVEDAHRVLERASRTAANLALVQRVANAATQPLANDAELIALAQLARTVREETICGSSPDRRSNAFARGIGARRRRR